MVKRRVQLSLLGALFTGGVVLSLVNAENGHGISTDEVLHEYVEAQLNGEDPMGDITDDPGDGTGTPDNEKKYYKKRALLRDISGKETYYTNAEGMVNIYGMVIEGPPFSPVKVIVEGMECKDTLNSDDYCDTRKEYRNITIDQLGTSEGPSVPNP